MTTSQADLFGALPPRSEPVRAYPPGLVVRPAFITAGEEAAVIARIDAAPLTPFRFGQWEGKRLTTSFGWGFDFNTGRMRAADPIPDWLLSIRERAAQFAGLRSDDLSQALLIRYDPGAGIGWHKDRPHYDKVIGLSLGVPAKMRFRQRQPDAGFRRASALLDARSVYLLDGDVRQTWEHSIAPMEQPRWSITFRSLSDFGRRSVAPFS